MGLSAENHQRLLAGLKPVVTETIDTSPDVVTEDATIGNEERLRGIPAVGRVSGTIKGTRPGDSAAALIEAGKEIVRGQLKRTRRKDHREN